MQRGSTTAAVAAMDAAGAVPAAIVGLLLLNDKIWPGREWLAGLGFLVTLAAVVGLTRYAEPQHHHAGARERQKAVVGAGMVPVQAASTGPRSETTTSTSGVASTGVGSIGVAGRRRPLTRS